MSIDDAMVGMYRGQRLGDRVDDRRNQLLEAAFQLLGEDGAAAVTMRAVTRKAGLSPRYFYESFADRAELLVAVFDRTVQQLQTQVAAAMTGAPADPVAQTRAALMAVARSCEEDPRVARILLREALAEDAMRHHAYAALIRFISTASLTLTDESWHRGADPVMVRLDVGALAGTTIALFLDWTEGRLDVTRQQLVDYCTDTVDGMIQRRAKLGR